MLTNTLMKMKVSMIRNCMFSRVSFRLFQAKPFFFLVFFFFVFSFQLLSQERQKPKVAVVLSGGGAKGIAHIPLLQMLDSLGIVPDLVVGTSMGSVVGGFYAMGYSGDSIAVISANADWDTLLGGKTLLKDVSVEEKSEFGRYLIDLDLIDSKLSTRASLLTDQFLREFFAIKTYPVFDVSNFDNLPIPYRAITTDIIHGDEVVLKEGSLAVAMRASMSIPSIFDPVSYGDLLLVDGGVLNNFPVDIAKEWGADIIIGSDVGGGMKTKEQLSGITDILFQTAMLVSNKKNPEARQNCDILIDHVPHLSYSTSDFNDNLEIYEEGFIGTRLQLEALTKLANELKNYEQKKIVIPEVEDRLYLDTIVFSGISKDNLDLVRSRADINAGQHYSVNEVVDGINRAMGTTLFNQIYAKAFKNSDQLGLEIQGSEHAKHQIRAALHFDNDDGIGILLNYTGRNFLGKSSRFLVTGDVSEEPAWRVQYQKQFGKSRAWWWRSELFGQYLNQELYISGDLLSDVMQDDYFLIENQFNKNIKSLESYIGFGLSYENSTLKPKVTPDVDDNFFNLTKYSFSNLELDAHFVLNNLNDVFFAESGTLLKLKMSRSLSNSLYYKSADEFVAPLEDQKVNNFSRLMFSYQKRLPVADKLSIIIDANANFIFQDKAGQSDVQDFQYAYSSFYFLGGNRTAANDRYIPFNGLNDAEAGVRQVTKIGAHFQYNFANKLYAIPHLDYASVGYGRFEDYLEEAFFPSNSWTDPNIQTGNIVSFGTTLAYNSILGPVNLDYSWVNGAKKSRFSFSLGLFINSSN